MQAITDECVNRLWWSVQSDSLTVIWCLRLLTLPPTVILPIAAFLSVTQSPPLLSPHYAQRCGKCQDYSCIYLFCGVVVLFGNSLICLTCGFNC